MVNPSFRLFLACFILLNVVLLSSGFVGVLIFVFSGAVISAVSELDLALADFLVVFGAAFAVGDFDVDVVAGFVCVLSVGVGDFATFFAIFSTLSTAVLLGAAFDFALFFPVGVVVFEIFTENVRAGEC